MIAEDYVSFEVAKLLKEKGYNWTFWPHKIDNLYGGWKNLYIPTLQTAMKWLREVHGLNVQPCIVRTIELKKAYNATIYDNNCEQIKSHFGRNIFDGFISYEEACEEAIKYCLTDLI